MKNPMKLKTFFIFNAILFGASGIIAIFFTEKVLLLYGVGANPTSLFMGQYAGLGSIAIALVTWFTRNIEDKKTQRTIVLALFITTIIGVVISISGIISGVMERGWLVVGIYFLFAAGYAYFLSLKEK